MTMIPKYKTKNFYPTQTNDDYESKRIIIMNDMQLGISHGTETNPVMDGMFLLTNKAKSAQNKQDIIPINIKTVSGSFGFDSFVVYCLYSDGEKVKNIFKQIQRKYTPKTVTITSIEEGSFTGNVGTFGINLIGNALITNYDKQEIMMKGLSVAIRANDGDLDGVKANINKQTVRKVYESEGKHIDDQKDESLVIFTKRAKSARNKEDIIKVNIRAYGIIDGGDSFIIHCSYSNQEKLKNIFREIRKKYVPQKIKIIRIYPESFTGSRYSSDVGGIGEKSITCYDKKDIMMKGLKVKIKVEYVHKVCDVGITCEYMKKLESEDALHCPIYYAMKEEYDFTEDNYYHLLEFSHFKNEFESKPDCKYGQECKAYIRSDGGQGGDRLDDKCHIKLFKHPPRDRNIQLTKSIHSLIFNRRKTDNHPLYKPTKKDKQKYRYNEKDGYLSALIQEVLDNGYKSDLCLECGLYDYCKHKKPYGILKIVDEKMRHIRHQQMGSPLRRDHMLALVLYTGCDANYALCNTQREGDYKKWKWFDLCLYRAVLLLSRRETGAFSVYSGLSGVKLSAKEIRNGYFATYTSTSWRQEVAKDFIGGKKGMLIQICEKYKNDGYIICCDVSWISKFPDECEILFARTVNNVLVNHNQFNCEVLDECSGVQTVCLRKSNVQ